VSIWEFIIAPSACVKPPPLFVDGKEVDVKHPVIANCEERDRKQSGKILTENKISNF